MKGKITYTQHTVAWPELDRFANRLSVYDDFLISGSGGEFVISCYNFGGQEGIWGRKTPDNFCVRFEVFDDGIGVFLDERVQKVVDRVRRARTPISAQRMVEILEGAGIHASRYHLDGIKKYEEERA